MKKKNFKIKSLGETIKEVKTAFKAAMKRTPYKPQSGEYFTSLEAARKHSTLKRKDFPRFDAAKQHVSVTSGEVIRILRGKKGWTQEELAKRPGISPTNLSMLENDRLDIGKKRAESLAHAFGIHPAIIMFPEYEAREINRKAA